MIKFQKILINFFLLLQLGIIYYLYSQQKLSHNHYQTCASILKRLWFHIFMALIVSILFLSIHLRNPGCLVVNKQDMQVSGDISTITQNQHENMYNDQEIKYKDHENIGVTQRAIFTKNHIANLNTVPVIPSPMQKTYPKSKLLNQFCHICQIYQPYRTKHCHECDSCVATYDHHCPWMNTCIGQKNRPLYYIFLLLQLIQAFGLSVKVTSIAINSLYDYDCYAAGIFSVVLIMFVTLILALFSFHTFLMMKNLTTWEFIKSQNISYMNLTDRNKKSEGEGISNKQKRRKSKYYLQESPFSLGSLRNIREYWVCGFKRQRKIWQFQCHN